MATKTIAASVSLSPARRRPPPCGRMTAVGGTTRRNSSHNSSGTSRSTRSAMNPSTARNTKGNGVLKRDGTGAIVQNNTITTTEVGNARGLVTRLALAGDRL
ncbi:hypothetical protein ACF1AO_32625 [Streptomyces longwoodensis]|uniref:hypothetical protein n=1 Tax=Streptomyces longwoodensis TaxID=68231 RepID=UPI0036FA3AA4